MNERIQDLFKNKSNTQLWHIDSTYLKIGSKLWCSKGWFRVIKLVDKGVHVVPDWSQE
jgi:transposase-like protein